MMKPFVNFIIVAVCSIFAARGQTTPVLKFMEGSVWVTGVGSASIPIDQWKERLRVYTQDAFAKRLDQPIAGTYTRHGDSVSFTPDFSFAAGAKYHVAFDQLELSFSIPEEKFTSTFVEAIHPQADVLPENMLRMYISFSGPMSQGEAFDHITLLTKNGKPVERAFLVIDQELWDPEHKRFTLLFDPGRVKRGIQSNVDLGAPLQAGQTYQLVVDSGWRDTNGNPLAARYTKTFTITAAERTKLNMQLWNIVAPPAGTLEDLLIEFDRPIDYVLALKSIAILASQTSQVSGNATLIHSRQWRFTPSQPWQEDQYIMEVHPQLEDVSGNNFNNAFDIDLSKESRVNSSEVIKHSFSIRPLVK